MSHNLEMNKKNAIAFYHTAYLGNPSAAVETYVGAEYIQHNPVVGDGKQAFIDYFSEMAKDYPDKGIEFYVQLQKGIWWHFTRIKHGQEMNNTSQWIFFDLMIWEKSLSTGIQYKKSQKKLKMEILCSRYKCRYF